MKMTEVPTIVTAQELGKVLKLETRTVWLMATRREIPSIKIGRNVRFDLVEVMASLKRRRESW